MKRVALALVASAAFSLASASPSRAEDPALVPELAPVAFLVGDWRGIGSSDAGAGMGEDRFTVEPGGHALVRHSHARYATTSGSTTGGGVSGTVSTYDSIMLIYRDAALGRIRADYVDDGGHTIHYTLAADSPAKTVRFVSDGVVAEPRFRLTYTATSETALTIAFELAPPGNAAFVKTLAAGTLARVGPSSP